LLFNCLFVLKKWAKRVLATVIFFEGDMDDPFSSDNLTNIGAESR